MADLIDRVAATHLLDRSVVVLLSGGRDSVCLLDLAARLSPDVVALHVAYGLRGEESERDAERCAALCDRSGVGLRVERAGEAPAAGNLHAWARHERLTRGRVLAARRGAALATGHTATDQAETVLYRLASSPSRRALLGMRAADDRGDLVRPLLAAGVTREETAAHCAARGLLFREDASNADPRFARARVRDGLVPALRAVHPAAEANVVRTAELLREEAEVLDALVAETLAPASDAIALERLAALPPALARLVLRRLAEDATGALCPRAASRLDDVLALGASGHDGALDLGDGARAAVRAGTLTVERTPPI